MTATHPVILLLHKFCTCALHRYTMLQLRLWGTTLATKHRWNSNQNYSLCSCYFYHCFLPHEFSTRLLLWLNCAKTERALPSECVWGDKRETFLLSFLAGLSERAIASSMICLNFSAAGKLNWTWKFQPSFLSRQEGQQEQLAANRFGSNREKAYSAKLCSLWTSLVLFMPFLFLWL